MPAASDKPLTAWGRYPVASCRLLRAHKRRDVGAAVAAAGGPIISRGLGRSYGDAALSDGGAVLLHTRLNRLIAFDDAAGVVEAEAGVTIGELIEVFLPRGWFPSVVPGTKFVTLGGAVAANVHGKNHHRDGAFAACVESFTLVTADGQTRTCSREQETELFWATLGGMGLTGAITTVRLRLMKIASTTLQVHETRVSELDALIDRLDDPDADRRYSVAWIDCLAGGEKLGRGVVMQADWTPPEVVPPPEVAPPSEVAPPPESEAARPLTLTRRRQRRVPFDFPSFALSRPTVRAFNALYDKRHPTRTRRVDYERFFFPLDAIHDWNRIYGKRGFIQYQAVFPEADGRAGIRALLERIAASGQASFLAVLKRMGDADAGALSFPMPGLTLALDLPHRGERLLKLTAELDRIVIDHGGRVYLAKDACLSRESFEAMYPRTQSFVALCRRIDPAGRFGSSLSRRLGLTEGGGA
jgi:FAD/FMN-containing dehydrogenase